MKSNVFTIIVTYNGMQWLKKTLRSLKKSTMQSTVIVVDNRSGDGTPQYIHENYPEIILIESPVNIGFGRANNIGIAEALRRKAEAVFLLNQDASVHPYTMEKLVELQQKHGEYGIISPIHLDGNGSRLDKMFGGYISPPGCEKLLTDLLLKPGNLEELYPLEFVNAAAWMMSKKCLEQVGGFDPLFFMYGEDNDYLYRVKQKGMKIGVAPGIFINHDRKQQPDKLKQTFKKELNWQWSRTLIRMKETAARRFVGEVFREYTVISINIMKSLLRFDIKDTAVYTATAFRLTYSLKAISRSRKMSSEPAGSRYGRDLL